DPYPAEQTHAAVGETGIAFKSTVVKDAFLFINLKTDAPIALDVGAQMSSCTRGVQVHFPVHPKIQERDAIGRTVLAHCRETGAIPSCQRLPRTFIRHDSVRATDLRRAHDMVHSGSLFERTSISGSFVMQNRVGRRWPCEKTHLASMRHTTCRGRPADVS